MRASRRACPERANGCGRVEGPALSERTDAGESKGVRLMRRDHKFLIGAVAGAAGALLATRTARARRAVDFGGRTVIITGGSRGLGLVMARQLAAEGARLCLLARDAGELDRARRLLVEEFAGAEILTVRCDIRRRAEV